MIVITNSNTVNKVRKVTYTERGKTTLTEARTYIEGIGFFPKQFSMILNYLEPGYYEISGEYFLIAKNDKRSITIFNHQMNILFQMWLMEQSTHIRQKRFNTNEKTPFSVFSTYGDYKRLTTPKREAVSV